jgi:hypothetical protein
MITAALIPPYGIYKQALEAISISKAQRVMLEAHFKALNRTITYTDLAKAAGFMGGHRGANLQYGKLGERLGQKLGEKSGFVFADSDTRSGKKFHGSSIGNGHYGVDGEFRLVMHHELAKAIEELAWVKPAVPRG